MRSIIFILLLLVIAEMQGTIEKIKVGEKFHVELQVPDEARSAIRIYLATFQATQPCEGYCLLEGFQELGSGRWSCSFRMTHAGTFEIPLGVFSWGSTSFVLPTVEIEASPQEISEPTSDWLRYPFVENLPTIHKNNQETLSSLLDKNQNAGISALVWKEWWRHSTGLFLLIVFSSHFLWNFMTKIYNEQRKEQSKELLPEQLLNRIYSLRKKEQVPWSNLLELLGTVWNTEQSTPTAHELKQLFSSEGKTELAKIASIIENYGYAQLPYREQFDAALHSVQPFIRREK
jgi:hypothetical protein